MMKSLQLLKAPIFLNQDRKRRRTPMMPMWRVLKKILDFVGDYDEADISLLVLE
jgi:hypothetical protein